MSMSSSLPYRTTTCILLSSLGSLRSFLLGNFLLNPYTEYSPMIIWNAEIFFQIPRVFIKTIFDFSNSFDMMKNSWNCKITFREIWQMYSTAQFRLIFPIRPYESRQRYTFRQHLYRCPVQINWVMVKVHIEKGAARELSVFPWTNFLAHTRQIPWHPGYFESLAIPMCILYDAFMYT